MAKSMRCKREKRLRAIKRDMVEPHYEKKDVAKLSAIEAALAASKVPVREKKSKDMDVFSSSAGANELIENDVEMDDGSKDNKALKPVGGIGKKRKFKVGKGKRGGKGKFKIRRKSI